MRRNIAALVVDVTFFNLALACLDTGTVLPVMVRGLGGDESVLGAVLTLKQAAFVLPPILAGWWFQGRTRLLPSLLAVVFASRIPLLPAAIAVGGALADPRLAIAAFTLAYMAAWAGDGMGTVAWTALIGRTIPTSVRGRVFAAIDAIGGAVRFGAGFALTPLLAGTLLAPPRNFGAIVLAAFLALVLSGLGLAGMTEAGTVPAPPSQRGSFRTYLRRLPGVLGRNPSLIRLAGAGILAGGVGGSIPFLAHAARTLDLHVPPPLEPWVGRLGGDGTAGLFLVASVVGQLVGAPFWGRLTDRHGPRRTLVGAYGLGAGASAAALFGIWFGGGLAPYLLAYLIAGAVGGAWSASLNQSLQTIHRSGENETEAIAVMNVAALPSLLLPLAGGWAVRLWGLPAPFIGAFALSGVAWWLARGLPDHRPGTPAAR
ncbi:MAG: MFS transporter [Armatimonadota bacterium]